MNAFKKRIFLSGLCLLVIVGGGFIAARPDLYFSIKKNFTIFSEVFRTVSVDYVDEVDPGELIHTAINAMLGTLDPYTVLIDERENQELDIIATSKYAGVGLEVGARGGKVVVIAPIEGYSASRKGVKAGDVLLTVNGQKVDNLSLDEIQNQLQGEPNTDVTLVVKRYGIEQPILFNLKRQEIVVHNVTYSGFVDPDSTIGYILIRQFGQNTSKEVEKALLRLKKNGHLRGLILDLRNNPGGLLSEAVGTVDLFEPPGREVVSTKGRNPENNSTYYTSAPAVFPNGGMAVLLNNGSASASEIVAGALQDLDRAVIIGQRSFGKGLVQIVKPLAYNTALKLTTAKYYTPSGRCIQAINYTHDQDYGAERVPDSLRKAYETHNGRTVFGGMGIEPDILIKPEKLGLLQIALLQQSQYFFFASRYTADHPKFVSQSVSDSLFSAFKEYLNAEHFHYQIPAQRYLSKLKTRLISTDSIQAMRPINTLDSLLVRYKEHAFAREAPEIREELYLEILSRYYGQKGKIRAELATDPDVQSAVKVLDNHEKYDRILAVKN
ncbi:MAG TPA: S41 family peptidase [Balneolales bacterium]|nr:S41 family peptidase [Balneolales bacterium]